MRKLQHAVWLTLAAVLLAAPQDAEKQLEAAIHREMVKGDLKGAVAQYRKILAQSGKQRDVAAKALFQLGQCQEKLGETEARNAYERLVKEYADQTSLAAQARLKLAALGGPAKNRGAISGLTIRRVATMGRDNYPSRISPDGRYLAAGLTNGEAGVRDLASGEDRVVTRMSGSGRVGSPVEWSPDGLRLAFTVHVKAGNTYEVRIVNLDGSGMKTVYRTSLERWAYPIPAGWSPDGKRILVREGENEDQSRLFWQDIAGGEEKTIRRGPGSLNAVWLSPNGQHIVFTGYKDKKPTGAYVISGDGSGETALLPNPGEESLAGWAPDSNHVLYTSNRTGSSGIWMMPVSGGKPQGPAQPVLRDLDTRQVWSFGVTRSGALHYRMNGFTSDLYTAPMNPATGMVTGKATPLPHSRAGSNVVPKWSRDGSRILYWWNGSPKQQFSLYSRETRIEQVIEARVEVAGAGFCWGQDYSSVVFVAPGKNGKKAAVVSADLLTGEARSLFEPGNNYINGLNCSSDGKLMAFHRANTNEIRVRNLDTGAETSVANADVGPLTIQISRDGSKLAYLTRSISNVLTALMVVPVSEGAATELIRLKAPEVFAGGYPLSWSPDNQYVYYIKRAAPSAPSELFRIPASGGTEEKAGLAAPNIRDIQISPDGRQVAFAMGAAQMHELWAVENFVPKAK